VQPGAFAASLARVDLDVPLVIAHDQLRRIARTGSASSPLLLEEVMAGAETGLRVSAPSLDPEDDDVAYITRKIEAGLVDEMSFAFRIDSGRWSEDFETFSISAVDIHRGDVAIVGYGANPFTSAGVQLEAPAAPSSASRERLRRARLAFARGA
jgi:HK97 family phage prohead protease